MATDPFTTLHSPWLTCLLTPFSQQAIEVLDFFSNFFFWKWILYFMEYFSLHPGLPLSTSNNQIKSQYREFSTDSIRFQFAIGSTFGRNFSPLPLIPGTVTSVKFPFIIITSVECSFIKPWMPVLYSGTLSQGDLPSNDCYKTLSLWDKLDDRGGENKMANEPLPPPPLWNFLSLKTYSSQVRLCFSAVDCISHPADKRGEKFTNQQVLYLWLHLLYLKLVLPLKKAYIFGWYRFIISIHCITCLSPINSLFLSLSFFLTSDLVTGVMY